MEKDGQIWKKYLLKVNSNDIFYQRAGEEKHKHCFKEIEDKLRRAPLVAARQRRRISTKSIETVSNFNEFHWNLTKFYEICNVFKSKSKVKIGRQNG